MFLAFALLTAALPAHAATSQIAAGNIHTVMLKSDGTLWGWGANGTGQLGDGTQINKSVSVQIGSDNKWISIVAGYNHTIALKSDGTLWAWGTNWDGQVGDGTTTQRNIPTQVGTDNKWVAVAGGYAHTVALKSDGTLWAWGNNVNGQLGDGTTVGKTSPIQIGTENKWISVTAGYNHTIAIKSDGTLWAWGYNWDGVLGDGTTGNDRTSPVQIGSDTKWKSVVAGGYHAGAIKSDGTLWAWGRNSFGQVGDGTSGNSRPSPVQISTDNKWMAVAAGEYYTIAQKSDGTIWGWGDNSNGALGDGTTVNKTSPVQLGNADNKWISIEGGAHHAIALKSDGSLWAWGSSWYGQVGDGTTEVDKLSPVQITTVGSNWAKTAAGDNHTLALKSDGTLWAWGNNSGGQLGDGTTVDKTSPVQIGTDNKWVSITAGYSYTLALKSDGTLWAWGWNAYGQLGDGTTVNKSSPVQIGTDNKWVSITPGAFHIVSLKSDGTLWAWGNNFYGQLGDGTTVNKSSPVQIGTDNKWVSILAGGSHTVALKSDGTLWAWGFNVSGQLGDGTTVDKSSPVQIGTDNKWVSIEAGAYHTVALKSDGTLWAWGNNDYGELGDGTTTGSFSPVQIGIDNKWVSISARSWRTVALKSDGTLWAWGNNDYGELGDGTTVDKSSPVQIGIADTTPPTGSISINSGAASTSSTSATLTLSCADSSGCSQMQFSNDNTTWSTAEVYATSKAWTLTTGDGTKMVYVKFKDTAGNWTTATISDTINVVAAVGTNTAPSFLIGTGFVVTDITGSSDVAYRVTALSGGKILVAGIASSYPSNFGLVRYNADGSLDMSFDGDGIVTTDFSGNSHDSGYDLAVQSDGKILVAGTYASGSNWGDFALTRYSTDGSLDTTFDGDGKVTTPIAGNGNLIDEGHGIVIQPDGKIIVAGMSFDGSNYDFSLVRYNTDGSLDTTFDGDGKLTTNVGSLSDWGRGVALQSDGKILVAGYSADINNSGNTNLLTLVRYNADGSLDNAFDTDGKTMLDIGVSSDEGQSVYVQSDGKILVAGMSSAASHSDFVLVRFNTTGSLDTTFSSDGIVTTDFGTVMGGTVTTDHGYSVYQQADGKILVSGQTYISGSYSLALARYNTDGSLDLTFGGGDGIVSTVTGSSAGIGYSVYQQADGKILVAGMSDNGSNYDFALVRYNADGSLDTHFNLTTNTLNGTPTYTTSGAAVLLDADVQIYDAELAALDNYASASLTLVRNGGANAQDVFSNTGTLSALTQGGNLTVGGITIGTVTTNSGGTLTLTFNSSATQTLVNSAMQQIAYSNSSSTPPTSVQINWTFNDGNTGAQGSGGVLSGTGSTTVSIIASDTTPPTGTLSINSGAAYTNSTSATLTLSCTDTSGCAEMQFSNDNTTWSTAEAYATSKVWTLTTGDGTKMVYAKFKDTAGNWSTASISDTIVLDTTAPTTTASPAGGTYTSAQSVTLTCSDGTGSGCDKIYYTTDGSTPTTSSAVYSTPISISVTTTLKFFAKDLVGNSEGVKAESYTIAPASGSGTWATKAPIPSASYGLGGAFVGGKFYAISGFATARVGIYDPVTDTWTTGAPLPADTGYNLRQYFGTAVLDGKIYVVGGDTGGSGDRDTLLRYDPALNSWATLAPMPLGSRHKLGAAAINGKIYAVGGSNLSATYYDRLEVYDPVTNTWATRASMPTAHSGALVGAINGKLIVAGGSNASGPLTALEIYNPATDSWSTGAPMPFTGNGDGVVLGGKLFSIGAGPSPYNRVFAYDAATNSWSTSFDPMPTGRWAIGVAADEANNKIYAVGGWNGSYVSALEVFTLSAPLLMGGAIQGTPLNLTSSNAAVATLAGLAGSFGSTDATGTSARFNGPTGITTDGTNLFVTDGSNHTIRKIVIATGVVTTLAGSSGVSGSTDGTGSAARFYYPVGITTDGTNLFVADDYNHTIRKIVIATGAVTTTAGSAGISGSTDGTGSAARFNYPVDVTTDGTNLFVTDNNSHTIRKIVISTGAVTTIAGSAGSIGSADGIGAAARFKNPAGITTDGTNLFVADSYNCIIRKIVISTGEVTTIAGSAGVGGSTDGTGSAARFDNPNGIITDGTNLFIVDKNIYTIRKVVISTGVVTTIAGSAGLVGSTDGTGSAARFYYPWGITTDGFNLFIGDQYNHTIRKISAAAGDTTAPTGTISINSGAASTNSTSATLTLSCTDSSGCSQMQFSNDNTTWSTAETYATSKAWTLSSGDGTKTVYVKFKDGAGNWSSAFSDTITLDTPISKPANIDVAQNGVKGELLVTWSNPADADFNHIHIYRSTASGTLGTLIADNVTGIKYTDTGLASLTTYYYTVRAVDSAGQESTNTNATANEYGYYPKAKTLDATPPAAPTGVTATDATTGGKINLSWTNPTDSDFSMIKVYRSTASGTLGSAVFIGLATSYSDTGLTNGTTYYYTVRAVDTSSNETTNTTQVSATPTAPDATPSAVPTPTGTPVVDTQAGGALTISWTNPADGDFSHIHIYRSTTSGQLGSLVYDNVTGTSQTDTGLTNNAMYYYTIRSVDTSGNESTNTTQVSGMPTDIQVPKNVTGLTVTLLGGGQARLDWTRSASTDINAYNIYYDNGTGTIDYTYANKLGTVQHPTVTWTSGNLTVGTAYKFAVRAEDTAQNEETNASVVISAVPVTDPNAGDVKGYITTPQIGYRISGSRVTVAADLISGNRTDVKDIRFQYKPVSSGTWTDITTADGGFPNPDITYEWFIYWDVTSLNGDYNIRAVATNVNLSLDTAPAYITVTVDNTTPQVTESIVGGVPMKEQEVSSTSTSNVAVSDATGVTELTIPEGALSSDTTVSVTITDPATKDSLVPSEYGKSNEFREIVLDSGQTELSNNMEAEIVIPYQDDNNDDIIDGTTTKAYDLKVMRYNSGTGKWERLNSVVDKSKKNVKGKTDHFTFFGLLAPPNPTVSGWNLVAVPLNPSPNSASSVFGQTPYVYNPTTNGYDRPSTIQPGIGYWIKGGANLTATGTETPTTGDFSITIKKGWNMIGNPFRFNVKLSDCKVNYNSTEYTMTEAETNGYLIGTVYPYINGVYQFINASDGGELEPWIGYWILSDKDMTLLVPPTPAQ